jgi:hypothetical protein
MSMCLRVDLFFGKLFSLYSQLDIHQHTATMDVLMFNLEPKSLLSPCASIHFRVHVLRVTGHAHHLFVVYNCAVVNHWILKLISMIQMQLDYVCYIYTTIMVVNLVRENLVREKSMCFLAHAFFPN